MTPSPSPPDLGQKQAEHGRAHKECDLVMKGGITSGIVYPALVNKLHEAGYSFRNVGGTSAGAIAAAVAAAAEYGKGEGGFAKLNEVRDWLGRDGNLKGLFQPSRRTAPLMNTLFGYSEMKSPKWPPLRLLLAFFRHDRLAFAGGALGGVLAALLFTALVSGTVGGALRGVGLIAPVFFGLLGALLACAWHLYRILKNVVPANGFGLCAGRGNDPQKIDETALTDWLHVTINDLAGKGERGADAPLTFDELWKAPTAGPRREDEKGIDLRMMTSNLSQNQPYVLPFDKDLFIFNERELRSLFPHGVVDHMVRRARRPVGVRLPDDFHFLPEGKDLPVIFAARLSLSFPVLISMAPLYTISQKAFPNRVRCEVRPPAEAEKASPEDDVERVQFSHEIGDRYWEDLTNQAPKPLNRGHMQRNWFSDGGICSNFPIHFFDSWLPRRPTFGVNLTSQLARGVSPGQQTRAKQAGDGTPADRESKEIEEIREKLERWRMSLELREVSEDEYAEATRGLPERLRALEEERRERIKKLVKERSAVPVMFDEFEGGGTRLQTQRGFGEDVYLPLPNEILPPEWIPIESLGKFLETVFRTAQNYRDNMQAMLPSYRERIVQIRLTDREGGLNLDMDEETIKDVVGKGEAAGQKLCEKFDLKHHQWVRFRVLMKQMESQLVELDRIIRTQPIYTDIVDRSKKFDTSGYPYVPQADDWLPDIAERLERMGREISSFKSADLFAKDPHPLPDSVLRVTPKI